MVSVKVLLVVPVPGAEAEMMNIDVPAVVGTPEITPEEERLKLAGRLPTVSDQAADGPETRVCE
jgi:hypothetical protein